MLSLLVYQKQWPFQRVLMGTWYATKALMCHIECLQKTYYCPLKTNRLVDDSLAANLYQRIDALTWTKGEWATGLEKGQCRLERMVRNHIGCALFVWGRLEHIAHQTGQTIYQVKHGLLTDYLR